MPHTMVRKDKTIFLLDDKVNAVGFERALAAVSRRKSEV